MKRYFIILFTLFSLIAKSQDKILAVSSASIFNDMVKNIGGEYVEALSIVPVGGDPHVYEATPEDARIVAKADLIFINGLTFEGWINEVIQNSGTKGKTILITKGVTPIESQDHKNAVDPHAWMDVSNGIIYCENILAALISVKPEKASYFKKNYETYRNKLIELDQYIIEEIKKIPQEKRVLITSHDAFNYYGKRYGLLICALMGISTEAEAQTSDIKRVIEVIRQRKVPAIFIESTINPKLLNQISQDHKVSIGGRLFADSIGEEGSGGDSYFDMIKSNTDVIIKALSNNSVDIPIHQTKVNYMLYIFLSIVMLLSWVVLIFKIK
jgi:ABC-type Zn uptake system ZnuABC Zn-binding protein ZnuA